MVKSVAYKILENHLLEGQMKAGEPIKIRIDNTLTQDATGTMSYLQLETLGIDRVKTLHSVSYVDHNTLQNGFMNADDHEYLRTVASSYGVYYSKCGNGICHQVNLERFDIPGQTLLGSDSHTPTGGAMGMIAIGAGGLDVALAMAGIGFRLVMPSVVNVRLSGKLKHGVSAKDIILKLLQMKTVKGGINKIFEYSGEGIKELSVPERSTICNMGAELGATTSLFPSDENTLAFLSKQGREKDYSPLVADEGCEYDEVIDINLDELEPLVAKPNQPDNVETVKQNEGLVVDQVCIGSCTNSSYTDLMNVASILKGNKVADTTSLVISFGSKQVLRMLTRSGALDILEASGARLLESTCGPCIGMGQSPKTNAVSLRTFNRNFYGRSGTESAGIYLVSPETAAISAIKGVLTSPTSAEYEKCDLPDSYLIDDSMILKPQFIAKDKIVRGPNIKPFPVGKPLGPINAKVMIKVGDNITTDHIMPAGAKVLPYRSNIEKISEFCYSQVDPEFATRCKQNGDGIILAKENYGQGSSREHAALAPLYLGIKAVLAKSYARIHRQNLINNGIIPLIYNDEALYDELSLLDQITLKDIEKIAVNQPVVLINNENNKTYTVKHDLNSEEIDIIMHGGYLNAKKATITK